MLRSLGGSVVLTALGLGCAATPPPPPLASAPPPIMKPSPASVTLANPGGDAPDPELAALQMLDRALLASRRDRWSTLVLQLPEAKYWRRVKLWGYPTRVAFRFGDEHYGVVAIWYEPARGPDDPESCLARFIAQGRPAADAFGVRTDELRLVRTLQVGATSSRPMVIDVIDASVDAFGETKEYAAALAAYTSWPGTCLVQGFVVAATKHRALARRIRDRWVSEAAPRLAWRRRVTAAPTFEVR